MEERKEVEEMSDKEEKGRRKEAEVHVVGVTWGGDGVGRCEGEL